MQISSSLYYPCSENWYTCIWGYKCHFLLVPYLFQEWITGHRLHFVLISDLQSSIITISFTGLSVYLFFLFPIQFNHLIVPDRVETNIFFSAFMKAHWLRGTYIHTKWNVVNYHDKSLFLNSSYFVSTYYKLLFLK